MATYLAKIQGQADKITITGTLKQAKAKAMRKFGGGAQGSVIVIIQHREGIGFNDVVAARKIGSKEWRTGVQHATDISIGNGGC